MPLQRLLQRKRARLPNIDCLVLRGGRYEFVVWGDSDGIDVLLMRHYGHICRFDYPVLFICIAFGRVCHYVPHLESVVLADGGEKVVLFGREANS